MGRIGTINLPTITTTISGQQITYTDTKQQQAILQKMATQLDLLSANRMAAKYNAGSQSPNDGGKPITSNPTGKVFGISWSVGDIRDNSNPQPFVVDGISYVTLGWLCIKAGNVGTANPPVIVSLDIPVNVASSGSSTA